MGNMPSFINQSIKPIVKRMLEESWHVQEGESILIVSDFPSRKDLATMDYSLMESMIERCLLSKRIYDVTKELISNPVDLYFMKPTYSHYENPLDDVLEEKIKKSDIVFTLTEFSLTDVPILLEPLERKEIRHISAPLVPAEVFLPGGPLDIDYYAVEELTTKVFNLVQAAKYLDFQDIAGSNLQFEFRSPINWIYESGFVKEKGTVINLPSGEVTLEIPYKSAECVINGNLNIFPGWQESMTQLLTLNIQNNRLIDVVGGGKVGDHLQTLINSEDVRVVQFGIGTNPMAKDPFSATVADKYIGMGHLRFAPDPLYEHFYFPISKVKINDKDYPRNELFEY